jgi:DNA-binding NtrC family response regulator
VKDYKILVVDGNTEILDVLELTLAEDYHIFKAQSAQEALDILSQQEIDLTITDQRMPGITGVELLEKTLAYNPRMIKILLTGYIDTNDFKAINQGKVYKYIAKPFSAHELKVIVKRALEHYEMERENKRLYQELQKAHKLENEIERSATMANGSEPILPEHLSERRRETQHNHSGFDASLAKRKGKLSERVEELERKVIEDALIHHQGNKTKAASELGLSRLGLRKKILRYGLHYKKPPASYMTLSTTKASC